MRRDARSLLEKLSRKDFRYREFADPFSDMELWPIFEVVLRDERVVGEGASVLPRREAPVRAAPQVSVRQKGAAPMSNLFGRYDGQPAESPQIEEAVNLRQFFGRLSDRD